MILIKIKSYAFKIYLYNTILVAPRGITHQEHILIWKCSDVILNIIYYFIDNVEQEHRIIILGETVCRRRHLGYGRYPYLTEPYVPLRATTERKRVSIE